MAAVAAWMFKPAVAGGVGETPYRMRVSHYQDCTNEESRSSPGNWISMARGAPTRTRPTKVSPTVVRDMKTKILKGESVTENSTGIGTVTRGMMRERAAAIAATHGHSMPRVS